MIGSKGTPTLIAEQLLGEIRSGKLPAGTALNQGGLAQRFGVSRIPVREALRQLESDGAIVYVPNRGAIVATFTLDEVEERFEIRMVLEPMALRLAMKNLTAADLRLADHEHQAMKEVRDARFWGMHHAAFHSALYEPAARPRLCAIIDSLYIDFVASLPDYAAFNAFRKIQDADHARILRACKDNDANAAAKALVEHLATNCSIISGKSTKKTSVKKR